jgi:hypothetical protein
VKRSHIVLARCLAVGHFAWGAALFLVAIWFAVSAFRVVPQMSTGTPGRNLLTALMMAMMMVVPLGALGVWTVALGRWTWALKPQAFKMLLLTHGILLVPGSLAGANGILALRAAEKSAAHGGGLLGGLGMIPLAFGVGVAFFALCSIVITLTAVPRQQASREPEILK